MAIGAMRAVRDMGLHVPGDVSVVGFDDIDLAQHVDPPLTTVHQPIRRKGEEAVRLLLAVIQNRGAGEGRAPPARDAAHRPWVDGTDATPRSCEVAGGVIQTAGGWTPRGATTVNGGPNARDKPSDAHGAPSAAADDALQSLTRQPRPPTVGVAHGQRLSLPDIPPGGSGQ